MRIETNKSSVSSPETYPNKVAKFWDKTSGIWREIWGPHIHHGYYPPEENINTTLPQERLLDKLTASLDILPGQKMLDVGCGMGETAVYLAKHFPLEITGINLSPTQLAIAQQRAKEEKLASIHFKQEDALTLNFADNCFDIVWSLESCEQFLNKETFIKQAYRVLKPQGKLLLVTWCSDQEIYEGKSAKNYLSLCQTYCIPYMPTIDYYNQLLAQHFTLLLTEDWSRFITPSWQIGLSKLKGYSYFDLLKFCNLTTLPLIWKVNLMADAFQQGHIRYGVFIAQKKG